MRFAARGKIQQVRAIHVWFFMSNNDITAGASERRGNLCIDTLRIDMAVETIDYKFLREQELREYITTLQNISSRNYAPIQCDQGSSENHRIVHACDYAVKLIKAELDTMLCEKDMIYAELDHKYGKYKWTVDMAGGVHITGDEDAK